MKTDKEYCLECQEPHTKMAKKVLHPKYMPEPLEALEAIQARVNGDYDHPALLKFGPLSHNIQADIALIATRAITKAKGE